MNTCAELFINNLKSKDLGCDVREIEDGVLVHLSYDNKPINMIFKGDNGSYFSLYITFENVPQEKVVDAIIACNELNTAYKWAKFYVDKDNDIMVQDDAILSVATAAEEAFEILLRVIDIAKDAKQPLMKAIYA